MYMSVSTSRTLSLPRSAVRPDSGWHIARATTGMACTVSPRRNNHMKNLPLGKSSPTRHGLHAHYRATFTQDHACHCPANFRTPLRTSLGPLANYSPLANYADHAPVVSMLSQHAQLHCHDTWGWAAVTEACGSPLATSERPACNTRRLHPTSSQSGHRLHQSKPRFHHTST